MLLPGVGGAECVENTAVWQAGGWASFASASAVVGSQAGITRACPKCFCLLAVKWGLLWPNLVFPTTRSSCEVKVRPSALSFLSFHLTQGSFSPGWPQTRPAALKVGPELLCLCFPKSGFTDTHHHMWLKSLCMQAHRFLNSAFFSY